VPILEPAYLDSLGIKLQALFLVGEELLDIFALITLKLDHLSHLSIDDDGAIASYCDKSDLCAYNNHIQRKEDPTELLLDDLEDLLLIKFLGETLDSRQSLATIALYE
jgi:hypothetical protein